ncbi:MAG: ECF transporter S component [Tepidanaerobacteraceae bacterium]|nr:ECF transporter S component [Tepidanaerobacteraceae bacterium]
MKNRKIVYIGLLGAMSFVLMSTFSIPILPQATFLRFEPSEIPAIFAAAVMGPASGVAVCLIKDLLYLMFRAKSIFGPASDFMASSCLVFVIGMVYQRFSTTGGFLMACSLGTLTRVLMMIPINLVILWLQFGMNASQVMAMMWPAIIPFNLVKSAINSLGAFVLLEALLRRASFLLKEIETQK